MDWTELSRLLDAQGAIWSKLKAADKFRVMWQAYGLSREPEEEFKFDPPFRWSIDYAWPELKLGVEIHGFGFGHQSQQGLSRDCQKMRRAFVLGWLIVPFTTRCISSKQNCFDAVEEVSELLIRQAQKKEGLP